MIVDELKIDIRLLPCPKCGGLPVVLIRPHAFESTVHIECSACGIAGPRLAFASRRALRELLPDLATARRQAAADWNRRLP